MSEKDFNEVSDEIIRYRYSNKPVVIATVDVAYGEKLFGGDIIEFLNSEGVKFDYLAYDGEKNRYYAMLRKKGFERCDQ